MVISEDSLIVTMIVMLILNIVQVKKMREVILRNILRKMKRFNKYLLMDVIMITLIRMMR